METFRFLTDEETAAAGIYVDGVTYAVAENESGEIVSMASFNIAPRGTMCDSCTGRCATGGVTWARDDYKFQGLFRRLFNWAKDELDLDPIYISQRTPEQIFVARAYDLAIPKEGSVPNERIRSVQDDLAIINNAVQIIEGPA